MPVGTGTAPASPSSYDLGARPENLAVGVSIPVQAHQFFFRGALNRARPHCQMANRSPAVRFVTTAVAIVSRRWSVSSAERASDEASSPYVVARCQPHGAFEARAEPGLVPRPVSAVIQPANTNLPFLRQHRNGREVSAPSERPSSRPSSAGAIAPVAIRPCSRSS